MDSENVDNHGAGVEYHQHTPEHGLHQPADKFRCKGRLVPADPPQKQVSGGGQQSGNADAQPQLKAPGHKVQADLVFPCFNGNCHKAAVNGLDFAGAAVHSSGKARIPGDGKVQVSRCIRCADCGNVIAGSGDIGSVAVGQCLAQAIQIDAEYPQGGYGHIVPQHHPDGDMLVVYHAQLQDAIEEVEGVSQVLSVAGSVGSQLPPSMLPEDLRSLFYADSGSSTQMLIFFDSPAASLDTMHAIQTIRQVANEKCFVAGFSALINDVQEMLQDEMPLYIAVAALLALAAMSVMMTSWVLPVAILLNIGLAILYNMGTNVIFGEISFVTQALAAILQLGVTMDYSVFLYNRYREELRFHEDPRNAMAAAIRAAFTSLSGSSLTTIAGFAALCFMRLGLGRDVGLVMMKGVLLGILCVVLVLPAILLVLDGPIHKRTHRCLNPDLSAMNRFLVKHRRVFVVIALAAYLPAVYS